MESFAFQAYKYSPLETEPDLKEFLKDIDESEQETIRYIGGWVIYSLSIKHSRERSTNELALFKSMTAEQIDTKKESGIRYREIVLTEEASQFVFGLEALLRAGYFAQVDILSFDPNMLRVIHKSLSTSQILRRMWEKLVTAQSVALSAKESVRCLQLYVQKYLRSRINNFLRNADLLPGSSSALRTRLKENKTKEQLLNKHDLLEMSTQGLMEVLGSWPESKLHKTFTISDLQKLLGKFDAPFAATTRKPDLVEQLKNQLTSEEPSIPGQPLPNQILPNSKRSAPEQIRSQKRARTEKSASIPQEEPLQGHCHSDFRWSLANCHNHQLNQPMKIGESISCFKKYSKTARAYLERVR